MSERICPTCHGAGSNGREVAALGPIPKEAGGIFSLGDRAFRAVPDGKGATANVVNTCRTCKGTGRL